MTKTTIGRRLALALPASLALAHPTLAATENPIAAIERRNGGRLGVFALDTGSAKTLAHRAEERFLMCSTFKGLLAAHILARVDIGADSLERPVVYLQGDLVPNSPTTTAHVAKGQLPVGELLQAMMELSDNTAANVLMRDSGGPGGLTRYIRGLGDTVTRTDRFETEANTPDGERDTTSPLAMTGSFQKILLGEALLPASVARIEGWMVNCQPGLRRLRAALPTGWAAGDRPGTNRANQSNDVAIIRPPGRAPLLVAAYYDAPGMAPPLREDVLRQVGAAIVAWAG